MARKRVRYRVSKAQGIFGIIWGGIFVVIGITVAIPNIGAFGVIWTLFAAAITVYNAYCAFGKGYVGPEVELEDMDGEPTTTEERLKHLRYLYDRRLITEEDYETKRKEILEDL